MEALFQRRDDQVPPEITDPVLPDPRVSPKLKEEIAEIKKAVIALLKAEKSREVADTSDGEYHMVAGTYLGIKFDE